MAPAIKRRKLEHSDSEEESEGSFAGFDEVSDAASNTSVGAEEDGVEGSDVSMNGAEDFEELEDLDDDVEEDDDQSEGEDAEEERKPAPVVKATDTSKPPKRPTANLQAGVYTSESFKSNLFKLQVDELLEQVKLRYGKKEASAENAMRTLKTIIEQIPSRDALPVCITECMYVKRLTKCRFLKLRRVLSHLGSQYLSRTPAHRRTRNTSSSTNDPRASMQLVATRSRLRLVLKISFRSTSS
jgi:cobalamin biosynthesis protein CobT